MKNYRFHSIAQAVANAKAALRVECSFVAIK